MTRRDDRVAARSSLAARPSGSWPRRGWRRRASTPSRSPRTSWASRAGRLLLHPAARPGRGGGPTARWSPGARPGNRCSTCSARRCSARSRSPSGRACSPRGRRPSCCWSGGSRRSRTSRRRWSWTCARARARSRWPSPPCGRTPSCTPSRSTRTRWPGRGATSTHRTAGAGRAARRATCGRPTSFPSSRAASTSCCATRPTSPTPRRCRPRWPTGDPPGAVFGGPDGLEIIRAVAARAGGAPATRRRASRSSTTTPTPTPCRPCCGPPGAARRRGARRPRRPPPLRHRPPPVVVSERGVGSVDAREPRSLERRRASASGDRCVLRGVATTYDCSDPDARAGGLAAAARAVRGGRLVVLPTDTVYGLGCDAFNAEAVRGLLAAKQRGPDMPVPVLVGSWSTIDGLVHERAARPRASSSRRSGRAGCRWCCRTPRRWPGTSARPRAP